MNYLQIQFPEDFEKRYKKYKDQILHSSTKNTFSKIPSDEPTIATQETENQKGVKSNPESGKKMASIEYNPITGDGIVNTTSFKFKDHQPEYRLFKLLCEKVNNKIQRYDVLVAIHFYEDGADIEPARKSLETEEINKVVKKIRGKTGLTTKQLVNNNGNVTLLGNIVPNQT